MKRILLFMLFYFSICILSFNSFAQKKSLTLKDNISPGKDSVIFKAGKGYRAGKLKKFFFGSHYRKEWNADVKAPVFDIRKQGLKAAKLGGGRQTITLRLTDSTGREYVLRSIDKTPQKALPEELRTALIINITQDQISADHPYAAFTIPTLAEAAGVFHTNPVLVFVAYDTAFGKFADALANKPALFEERPDGPMKDAGHFGNPPNIIGTEKMLEKRFDDNDNLIDERLYARSRLFDMVIGDWGRHEDQWRWGVFPHDNGSLLKPIPRDRDHAYFKFDGLFPSIFSQSWALRNLRNFGYEIKDLKGLTFSARNIDRIILTSLSKEEWITIADSLKLALTDKVIEAAIRRLPESIFKISGPETICKLKIRRDHLHETAEKYYELLAKEVDIYGSDKNERFEVKRFGDKETEISVFKISKEGNIDKLIYHRIFYKNETKEIRLYGLEGNDQFYIYGKVKDGIKVRVIGGEGRDVFSDSSLMTKGNKKIRLYDSGKDNSVYNKEETRDLRSDKIKDSVHVYSYNFNYNVTRPFLNPEYNIDDGIFLGAGIMRRTHGFRKFPYATFHRTGLNFAAATNAFSFKYYGDFRQVYRQWNFSIDARLFGPGFVLNYFGFGNEQKIINEDIDFYRVRAKEFTISPLFYQEIKKKILIGFGPLYQFVRIEKTQGRFISTSEANIDSKVFEKNHFSGGKFLIRISGIENILDPLNGIRWNMELKGVQQLYSSVRFFNINSDVSFFWSPNFFYKFITFATRIGGASNMGDFYFFQANTLGGTSNLRGYRRTTFYGRSSFYNNNEIRLRLLKFRTYIFPAKLGLLGFYDNGRVWADGENSNDWHFGYGPGIWIEIFNKFLVSGTFGISKGGNSVNVQVGFLF